MSKRRKRRGSKAKVRAAAGGAPAEPSPLPGDAPATEKTEPPSPVESAGEAPSPRAQSIWFRLFGPSESHAGTSQPHARHRIWWVLAAIVVSWCFGFGMRTHWADEHTARPGMEFQGERLISTEDGYYYATGIRTETEGFPIDVARAPASDTSLLVALGATVVNVFGITVHELAALLPAVLSPLIALPLILLGLMFRRLLWGFLAASIAVLGFSYWNRTIPHYFDTDMLAIPYVYGVTVLIIAALWRRQAWYGVAAALLAVAANYVHPGSERVLIVMVLALTGYCVVFARQDTSGLKTAVLMLFAFAPAPGWLRALAILGLGVGLTRLRPLPWWSYVAAMILLSVWIAPHNPAMRQVLGVIGLKLKDPAEAVDLGGTVRFAKIDATVSELTQASLATLANRLSGGLPLLLSGTVGVLAMCWRFRPLLLLLPLVWLGTSYGGQRFTVFAVPIIALGNVYLFLLLGRMLTELVKRHAAIVERAVAVALTPIVLIPAIDHAMAYPARSSLTTHEAEQLTELSKQIEPGDMVIAWWDYAYGIWYFSGASTIIDGAKQNEDTWIVAEAMFTSSQRESASLARLAAEDMVDRVSHKPSASHLVRHFMDETGREPGEFVAALRDGTVPLPPATRKVFLYLPWRLLTIAPNVVRARAAKGLVDEDVTRGVFLIPIRLDANGKPIRRTSWAYDPAQKSLVGINRNKQRVKIPVYKYVSFVTNTAGLSKKQETILDEEGRACVINIPHSRLILYMDRSLCGSVMTQLMFLNEIDRRYFELVSAGRGGVIYRVLL